MLIFLVKDNSDGLQGRGLFLLSRKTTMKPSKEISRKPLKLSANNFTPLVKTPWAGDTLKEKYKKHLSPKENIGESWELSFDPAMSSELELTGEKIFQIASLLKKQFGMSENENFNLLVKLLSAGKNLSVQIHPDYDDENLKQNECGKYESWLILEAKKGAGIYLDFKTGVTEKEIEDYLKKNLDLSQLLNFIPVKKGDYFDIPPGTAHAIGAGITLLEPQRVLFGKSGITYRFWDWDRTYDEHGQEKVQGKKRDLHLKESLRLLSLKTRRDPFSLKKQPELVESTNFFTHEIFRENPYYELQILNFNRADEKKIHLQETSYFHLLVLEGNGSLETRDQEKILLTRGDSFLLCAHSSSFILNTDENLKLSLLYEKE